MKESDRPKFQYPDASGAKRTWAVYCCVDGCLNMPTRVAAGKAYNKWYHSPENQKSPVSHYGSIYCDEHAFEWTEPV